MSDPLRPSLDNKTVAVKVVYSLILGGFAYFVSALADQTTSDSVMLSVFIGGVIFISQLLVDFEKSLIEVRRSVHDIDTRNQATNQLSEGTQLLRQVHSSVLKDSDMVKLLHSVARYDERMKGIAVRLAAAEIAKTAKTLKQLHDGTVVYEDGEDRDWLLGLTRAARLTIDATSTTTVDGCGSTFGGGFWAGDLGRRYLRAQAKAIQTYAVTVRRLFILEKFDDHEDSDFLAIVQSQTQAGIEVRAIHQDRLPEIFRDRFDIIIYDDEVAYELLPEASSAPQRGYVETKLITDDQHVSDRKGNFEMLWSLAEQLPPPSPPAS